MAAGRGPSRRVGRALIAIALDEPEASCLVAAIDSAPIRLISAAMVVECSLVLLGRHGEAGDLFLDRLLRAIDAEIVSVDDTQVRFAREAAVRFGRGRHAAALNFGDCFSYALAIARDEPLLYVGNDFALTDVESCQW